MSGASVKDETRPPDTLRCVVLVCVCVCFCTYRRRFFTETKHRQHCLCAKNAAIDHSVRPKHPQPLTGSQGHTNKQ